MKLCGRSNHGSGIAVVCLRTLVLCCFFLIAFCAGFAQTVSNSPDASSAQQGTPSQPKLKTPIHIVPFREPGTIVSKPFFAVGGAHADYFGGPVIANVHIVQVLYGAGAYLPNVANSVTPNVAGFFTDITQSPFFDMLSEYGTAGVTAFDGTAGTNQTIGHGFFDGQFSINPSPVNNGPVINDTQIQNELLSQVAAGHLPAPVIDAQGNSDTLYMIFFPPGRTITAGNASSCVKGGFCAYHTSTTGTFGSKRLFYGVFPDVQPPSLCSIGCGVGSPFDVVTNVTSHELSEAVTDPDVGPAATFARPLAWADQTNGEIGDICSGQASLVLANGTTYRVQQEFSNLQNDCVAAPPLFQITAGPNIAGGQNFDLDLRIADSNGFAGLVTLGTYSGTVHFASSDPAAVLPADYVFGPADAGFHHFVATLNTSGAQTITVTDTKLPGFTGSATLQVNVPNVAQLRLAAPANATTGTAVTVVITALDSTQTLVTNYNGTVHFSSSDPAALLPPDSQMTNGTGIFAVTLNTPGLQTLQATDKAIATISGTSQVTAAAGANPTTTTLTGGTSPIIFGQSVNYVMTVTGNGATTIGGSMSVTVDGLPVTSGGIFGSSNVLISASGGTHTVYANYFTDGTFASSSSAPVTLVVNPAPDTITVTSSQSSAPFGVPITLNAQFTPFGGSRGSVTFFDGANPLGIISLNQAFLSGLTLTSLPVGSHSITAAFSGSPDFLPSTSTPIQLVITPAPPADYSVTPDQTSATVSAGQTASFVITTKSLNGFAGDVRFSCGNLPSLTTCTFSPATVFVSSAAPSAIGTLTVKTTGPHALLLAYPAKQGVNALWWILGPFTAGVVLLSGLRPRSGALVLAVAAFVLVAGLVSCGGGSAPKPPPLPPPPTATPAGTSTITVSASGFAISGASPANASQKINITITVLP